MKIVVWALVVLLIIVRNDFWNWENDTLLMGFLPLTLAYQCGISIAASITWYLATVFAWPEFLEDATASNTPAEHNSQEVQS